MAKPTRIVPENIARLMSPEDRQKHGIKTAEESMVEGIAKLEKDEHQVYLDWGKRNDLPIRHDRTDKRVTGTVGWPDTLLVYGGMVLMMEFKLYGNKLSQAQKEVHAQLDRSGTNVIVVHSADEAIRRSKGWLWEHFRWEPK
jgi:hypothetical protein